MSQKPYKTLSRQDVYVRSHFTFIIKEYTGSGKWLRLSLSLSLSSVSVTNPLLLLYSLLIHTKTAVFLTTHKREECFVVAAADFLL